MSGLRYLVRDLDAAMEAVLARVRADADGVGPDVTLAVDPRFGVLRDDDEPSPAHHVVVRIENNITAVGLSAGIEAGCATVMSVVQDAIIDSSGRPWPEVDDAGDSVGVLDVAQGPAGIAHWALRGEPICPVGQLVATCRALGWHIR